MTREPGGRCLIYDAILSLSPLLSPSGKRRLYFLSARDGAESSVNFLFFKTFSLDFALQFRDLYSWKKTELIWLFFLHSPSRRSTRLTRFQDISSFAKYLSFPTCGGEEEEIQRCVNWKGWLKCFAYKVNGEMERMQQKKKKERKFVSCDGSGFTIIRA